MLATQDVLEQALKQWHRQEKIEATLDTVLPHLTHRIKADWPESRPPLPQQLTNHLLLDLLEGLAAEEAEAAALLRRRYIDDQTGFAVANSLGISESAFYRRRRDALAALAGVALNREAEARQTQATRLESRLEVLTYQHLFGLDNLRARLSDLLCQQTDIRLFCLAGIGGIGKTTLADALARDSINRGCFAELAWVSARQQHLAPWGEIQETGQPVLTTDELISAFQQQLSDVPVPPRSAKENLSALKTRLARQPHLLILDNLETVADLKAALPLLNDLSQLAWIVLTSRVALHDQPGVHITNLAELSQADAETLIRDEAHRRGIEDLATASAETMDQIYAIAGGNPLALKLLIGQVHLRSLPTTLTDFSEARGQKVEALYEYIYRRAWELLDETARRVLLTMPLVASPGTTLEHLVGVTELAYDALNKALDLLIRLSLVNIGGSLEERRYSIHRLTETFLHKQVTKWGYEVSGQ